MECQVYYHPTFLLPTFGNSPLLYGKIIRARRNALSLKPLRMIVMTVFVQVFVLGLMPQAQVLGANTAYPSMAPLEQYLITDREAEITLARSAAPRSISDGADVMVLGGEGYTTAAKGTNGFLCLVERSWGASTDAPDFWNPKVRSPIASIRPPQGPLCLST